MKKAIYKYQVTNGAPTVMPDHAKLLHVGEQDSRLYVWALVDPTAPNVKREIRYYGTGHPIIGDPGEFIGTVQMSMGLVWHFFDKG